MDKRVITLCYRKIIDINSPKTWEKLVFEDSYLEFKMQSQFYNQEKKYTTFSELLHNVNGADKLHFLVSNAIIDYLRRLNEMIPDIVNNLGKQFLTFKQFKFEIVNSNINLKEKHVVAINFYSEPLIWHDTIASYLLTSPMVIDGSEILTDLFAIQPFLTIHSIKQ